MTDEELTSLVANSLSALIGIAGISSGIYLFGRSLRKGVITRELLLAIMLLILFGGFFIFLVTHFVKGG